MSRLSPLRFATDKAIRGLRILNHKSAEGSVTAIYDRYDRQAEMRRALFAWGSKLEGILEKKSPKVVRIG